MSSSGTIRATMPLLPWRPAILSPTEIFRFSAMYTFTSWMTPGGSSSGWRILSIWSSAFSSTLARSRAAMSMVGADPLVGRLVGHPERLEVDVAEVEVLQRSPR